MKRIRNVIKLGFQLLGGAALVAMSALAFAQGQSENKVTIDDVIAQMSQNGKHTSADIAKLKEAHARGPEMAKRRYPKEDKSPASNAAFGKAMAAQMKGMNREQSEAALQKALNNPSTRKKSDELNRGKPADAGPKDKAPWK